MNVIQALEIGESLCASEAEQVLAGEVRELRAMLTEQRDEHARNSANATTQCIAYQQEIAELREQLAQEKEKSEYHKRKSQENYDACVEAGEQLAQERKRLDWALSHDAMYYKWQGDWCFCYTSDFDLTDILVTDDPRATIDELIAAEAAGGGK